jgi:dihydroflavonol-4-reductase
MAVMGERWVLVTGATGLIGNAIAHALSRRGDRVRVLARQPERARAVLPAGVEIVRGDILDEKSVVAALAGVSLVFHAAGMPEQWQADESVFDRANRDGTRVVLSAALSAGVERVVYTSTMDVFAAPRGGSLVETNIDVHPKPTAYERSKQAAEREAAAIEVRGLDVVYVNPAAVYGPAPIAGTLNQFFVRLLAGKVPMVPPGGLSIAYIDGVAFVHLAAAEKGRKGERYLVADEHHSMAELAREARAAEGRGGAVPRQAPLWAMQMIATISAPIARTFGIAPFIAPGELAFLTWDAHVDATKAKRELGFVPTPAREGVRKTISALLQQNSKLGRPATTDA